MITFRHLPNNNAVDVLLDGKIVGRINQVINGWQYSPAGRKKFAGEIFPTLFECKKSLLG